MCERFHRWGSQPQFSLRGLLWFVAAFSAYVSMLAGTARWAGSHPEDGLTRPWIVTLFATWAILFLFLRSRGVRGMLVAHSAGPVVGLVFVPLQNGISSGWAAQLATQQLRTNRHRVLHSFPD